MAVLVPAGRRSLPDRARYCEVLVITKTVRCRVSGHRKPYHLHVATEYGAYGEQPWRDAEPQHPGQPRQGDGPPEYEAPPPAPRPRRRPAASTAIAGIALVLGLIGLVVSVFGVVTQVMPRQFTADQQREIVNWELGRNWRALPASKIFPTSVSYPPPAVLDDGPALTLTAGRIGVARQAACRAATDAAAATVLVRNGCSAVLRATYTDGTKSYVVTVGVAVLPSTAQAATAARRARPRARYRRDRPRCARGAVQGHPGGVVHRASGGSCRGPCRPAPTWRSTRSAMPTAGHGSRSPATATPTAEMTSVGKRGGPGGAGGASPRR